MNWIDCQILASDTRKYKKIKETKLKLSFDN